MVEIVVELNVSNNDRAGKENLPVLNGESILMSLNIHI
jgi:hypothetical protein